MSMGFFLEESSPVIWRGPIVMGIVRQFLRDVELGPARRAGGRHMPPGTGDAQLTLMQQVPVSGGRDRHDAAGRRAARWSRAAWPCFAQVKTPVLGRGGEHERLCVFPGAGRRIRCSGWGGARRSSPSVSGCRCWRAYRWCRRCARRRIAARPSGDRATGGSGQRHVPRAGRSCRASGWVKWATAAGGRRGPPEENPARQQERYEVVGDVMRFVDRVEVGIGYGPGRYGGPAFPKEGKLAGSRADFTALPSLSIGSPLPPSRAVHACAGDVLR